MMQNCECVQRELAGLAPASRQDWGSMLPERWVWDHSSSHGWFAEGPMGASADQTFYVWLEFHDQQRVMGRRGSRPFNPLTHDDLKPVVDAIRKRNAATMGGVFAVGDWAKHRWDGWTGRVIAIDHTIDSVKIEREDPNTASHVLLQEWYASHSVQLMPVPGTARRSLSP